MGKMTFVTALKSYFGLKPGQSIAQFAAELKDLTPADKTELHGLLCKAGFDCDPPVAAKK